MALTSFNEIACSIMAFLGLYGRKVIILQYDEKEYEDGINTFRTSACEFPRRPSVPLCDQRAVNRCHFLYRTVYGD